MPQTALTIGTAYPDRYMAGTGTEDDPWIIGAGDDEQNFQNFLDAIYTESAYIKLSKNIDVSKSLTYREGFNHRIDIYALKLYADENKAAVNGMIIRSNYGLFSQTSASIENIRFLNMIHQGGYETIYSNTTTNYIGCDFSIIHQCDGLGYSFSMASAYFKNCSIQYQCIDYQLSHAGAVFKSSFVNCQIHYTGPIYLSSSAVYSLIGLSTRKIERVGITGNLIALGGASGFLFNNCKKCYFAGTIQNDIGDATLSTAYNSTNCLAMLSDTGENATATDTTIIAITEEQLKDRDYLYSIGFLP